MVGEPAAYVQVTASKSGCRSIFLQTWRILSSLKVSVLGFLDLLHFLFDEVASKEFLDH
jgi:hypothetical protein